MAIVNKKTQALINADASPQVVNNSWLVNSPILGSIEVAASDSDTSTFRFARIPDTTVIKALEIRNTAITAGTVYKLGLYEINEGLAVDDDILGTPYDMSSARATFTDILINNAINKPLYELLGQSYSTGKTYDLVFTGSTVGTADGTISLRLTY